MLKINVTKGGVKSEMEGSTVDILAELAMGADSILNYISNASDEPYDMLLVALTIAITEAKSNRMED